MPNISLSIPFTFLFSSPSSTFSTNYELKKQLLQINLFSKIYINWNANGKHANLWYGAISYCILKCSNCPWKCLKIVLFNVFQCKDHMPMMFAQCWVHCCNVTPGKWILSCCLLFRATHLFFSTFSINRCNSSVKGYLLFEGGITLKRKHIIRRNISQLNNGEWTNRLYSQTQWTYWDENICGNS